MTGRAIKTIAVYCGSNTGQGDVYLRAADALGRHLAKSGIGIVYGGTHKD
jgi:predicted Rossmann-fold nucleotide-binding protein